MKRFLIGLAACMVIICSTQVRAEPLRIGILPVLDTLPLQVAKLEGLFQKYKMDVELVPFMSALERDTAMKSGRLDGYFGDLIATLVLIDSGTPMKIVTVSYATTPGSRMFGVVTRPGFEHPAENKSVSVAISQTTIIEYLLDRMTSHGQLDGLNLERIEIKKIPIRMQMLTAGQIDTALLPEPLLSLAASKGGTVLATDETLGMPLTVLCIDEKSLARPGLHEGFIKAYSDAVAMLRDNPNAYCGLMAEVCRIPDPLATDFPVYKYPLPELPTPKHVSDVQQWMIAKGMLDAPLDYNGVVMPLK
jgi:NitT/TauT family transport system substrate-binding protein